jgi:UDP-hydrolysing UDP-N-acetyl-D-glucosamine 2-epimerase
MKHVAIVTTSRADYSIYVPVAQAMLEKKIKVSFLATGSHLSRRFNKTVDAISKDGFHVAARVLCELKDDKQSIAKAMGQVTQGMAKAMGRLRPEAVLVLGDRYEMLASALAAVPLRIPLIHFHGGEASFGSLDEFYRHAITKLSMVHLVSCKDYAKRVIKMGEDPDRVFTVGAPGLDNALNTPSLSADDMTKRFGVNLARPFILLTLHPVTTQADKAGVYVSQLIDALKVFSDMPVVMTGSNADLGGQIISRSLKTFASKTPNAVYVENFGTQGYVTALRHAAMMLGNSSSGIIEAASYQLPVVNIGPRQDGRIKGRNIIDCVHDKQAIVKAIRKALTPAFKRSLRSMSNPYGDGQSSQRIANIVLKLNPKSLTEKVFYDGN